MPILWKGSEVGMKQEYIVELRKEEADELMDEHWVSELVRCKDCKHWDAKKHECHNPHSYMQYRPCFAEWFCADGERRDDDA